MSFPKVLSRAKYNALDKAGQGLPDWVKQEIELEINQAFALVAQNGNPNMLTPRWVTRKMLGTFSVMMLSYFAEDKIKEIREKCTAS